MGKVDVGVGKGAADVGRSGGIWWKSREESQVLHILPKKEIKKKIIIIMNPTFTCLVKRGLSYRNGA